MFLMWTDRWTHIQLKTLINMEMSQNVNFDPTSCTMCMELWHRAISPTVFSNMASRSGTVDCCNCDGSVIEVKSELKRNINC